MKNIKIIAAAVCVLVAACSSDVKKAKTSLEQDNLVGKVKKVVMYQSALTLNEAGEAVKDTVDLSNNAYTIYEYDQNGNMTVSELRTIDDKPIGKQDTEFDERNNPVKVVTNNFIVSQVLTQESTYDDQNRVLETTYKNTDGKITGREVSEYDGNVQKVSYYNVDGKIISHYFNTFDDAGNIIDNRWYSDSIATSHYSAVFDSLGNRIEVLVYDAADKVENRFKSTYDDKGNILTQMGIDSIGGEIFRLEYKYEFDAAGNWTTCEEWQLGEFGPNPVSVIEREIEYYE